METGHRNNLTIVGVSVDSSESHHAFIRNLALNFPLAADTMGELCGAMGTCPGYRPGDRAFGNMVRAAFLVAPDGHIRAIYNANGSPALIAMIWDTVLEQIGEDR